MSIALALGQIEEAKGLLEEGNRSGALLALALARSFLAEATAVRCPRCGARPVAVAHYTPIAAEETGS